MNRTPARSRRHGFTLMELLIAMALSVSLLTAAMAALDASFDSYRYTSESASTHVVSRVVMHRMLALIRTGDEFGPYPMDVLDANENPLQSDYVEFVSLNDEANDLQQITRIERRDAPTGSTSPYELWYILTTIEDGSINSTEERPLMKGIIDAVFTLEYDRGPRLRRATIDLTIESSPDAAAIEINGDIVPRTIRLVASATPRRID